MHMNPLKLGLAGGIAGGLAWMLLFYFHHGDLTWAAAGGALFFIVYLLTSLGMGWYVDRKAKRDNR